jgi:hypothetical protein
MGKSMFKKISILYVFFVIVLVKTIFALDTVTIAILAKDKEHVLNEYLSCIERQTWPKDKTYLYIRTNNNNDQTSTILRNWVSKIQDQYLDVYFDDSDVVEHVESYLPHEWNSIRFKVLGKIRQDSVDWALEKHSHYFVADCDNFIKPEVIETLINSKKPIIAPFLRTGNSYYSNYHAAIDKNGYFASTPLYLEIFNQQIKGFIEVPVVHCSYLIRYEVLDKIYYDDNSYRYEYVIFSDSARKNNIKQYLDNREVYGRITFADDRESFINEPFFNEITNY